MRSVVMVGGLASLVCGCASGTFPGLNRAPEISLDWGYQRDVDFTGMRSFSWLPTASSLPTDPRIDTALLDKRVREAIARELGRKGFTYKMVGTPDFYVSYEAELKKKLKVSGAPAGYGFDPGWGWHHQGRLGSRAGGPNPYVREADAGSLALNIIEPGGDRVIWRGVAEAGIDLKRDSESRKIERIDRAVRSLLERFPPR